MARVVPMAFPVVEAQSPQKEPSRPKPLLPWETRSVQLKSQSKPLFPDTNGARHDDRRQQRRQEIEAQQEQELAEKVATAVAEGHEQGHEQGREQGHEQGYAEGLEQGQAAAQQEVDQLKATLRGAIEVLTSSREEMLSALETDLAELVLILASQLAGGAIDVEPARIVELARQGMHLLAESDSLTIRAASTTSALLREEQNGLSTALNTSSLRIVEDPTLEPEGCIVESELGRVDLRVSQRLQAARDLLSSVRNED